VQVQIKDFKFSPQPVNAKVGDVVGWTNGDSAPHSATMDDGSCSTDTISQGATGLLVFNTAGTYTYHCKVHPTQMKDFTVVVS
jgi:plastocyanin